MATVLQKKIRKDKMIRAFMQALGVATVFSPQIAARLRMGLEPHYTSIENWFRRRFHRPEKEKKTVIEQAAEEGYELLPENHPQRAKLEGLMKAAGVSLQNIFVERRPGADLDVFSDIKGRQRSLFIRGHLGVCPQAEKVLTGMVSHELVRIRRNDSYYKVWDINFVAQMFYMRPMVIYMALAIFGFAAPMATAATLGSMVGGVMVMRLTHRAFMRNCGFVADLKGVEIAQDPDAMLKALEYAQTREKTPGASALVWMVRAQETRESNFLVRKFKQWTPAWVSETVMSDKKQPPLEEVYEKHNPGWLKALFFTYAAPDRRIEALRQSFTFEAAAPAPPEAGPPAPDKPAAGPTQNP